jgi:hypothetical protein
MTFGFSGGLYSIMFSEEIKEGGFIISPRVDFVVNSNMLGGLMVLFFYHFALSSRLMISTSLFFRLWAIKLAPLFIGNL